VTNVLFPRRLFFFDKWYFDAQCPDGTFVFLYFASLTLAGVRSGQFVISLVPATGESSLRSLSFAGRDVFLASDRSSASFRGGIVRSVPFSVQNPGAGVGTGVTFGAAVGTGVESGVGVGMGVPPSPQPGIDVSLCDVRVRLSYSPLDPPWLPADGGTLLRQNGKALTWQVPIPCARVEGEVGVGSASARISGLGYHDFVQTDIPPWRIPLRDLLWGRALGEGGALIWNRPLFRIGGDEVACCRGWSRVGSTSPVECGSIGFRLGGLRKHDGTGETYPDEMSLEFDGMGQGGGTLGIELGRTRMFLGDNVADVTGFSNRVERWLYRTFTGNPVEYKLLSEVVSSGPFQGMLAAHERVLWGRGRR
jgi:hypothetical protein